MNPTTPWPVLLFFIALILPPELSVELGGLRLSAYRVVLLLMFLPCLYTMCVDPRMKLHTGDYLMFFYATWCLLSILVNNSLADMIEKGGILTIETLGAYMLARVYIRTFTDFKATIVVFIGIMGLLLVFTVPEMITGTHYLRGPIEFVYPERWGLNRAYGPFDHPILMGVFCATAFSYAYYVLGNENISTSRKALATTFVVLGTFSSLSAGAFMALFAQLGLVLWDKVTSQIVGRWWYVLGGFVCLYISIDLLSNRSPIAFMVSHASFSGQTAYFRILIFEYGSMVASDNPILGIGFNPWPRPSWMPSSVDNFWLLQAMRYGMPGFFALVGALGYFIVSAIDRKNVSPTVANAGKAWGFSLISLFVVGCTVAFWNSLFVLFFFSLGFGCWILSASQDEVTVSRSAPRPAAKHAFLMGAPQKTLF